MSDLKGFQTEMNGSRSDPDRNPYLFQIRCAVQVDSVPDLVLTSAADPFRICLLCGQHAVYIFFWSALLYC